MTVKAVVYYKWNPMSNYLCLGNDPASRLIAFNNSSFNSSLLTRPLLVLFGFSGCKASCSVMFDQSGTVASQIVPSAGNVPFVKYSRMIRAVQRDGCAMEVCWIPVSLQDFGIHSVQLGLRGLEGRQGHSEEDLTP